MALFLILCVLYLFQLFFLFAHQYDELYGYYGNPFSKKKFLLFLIPYFPVAYALWLLGVCIVQVLVDTFREEENK